MLILKATGGLKFKELLKIGNYEWFPEIGSVCRTPAVLDDT